MSIKGRWRIVEMELWDEDAIDLVGPAFIEVRDDDQGSFRFIAVARGTDLLPHERRLIVSSRTGDGYLTSLSNFWTNLDVCRAS